ncbi:MAG: type I-G CRISPR-associated RAMP protein Csb1/Cas7g [Planctomycetota bacterium]
MSEASLKDVLALETLSAAVRGSAAAFRCRRRLEPAGGPGDKVFPPTFSGAKYALEHRRIPGRDELVPCVLLDTVQSQANRMELALEDAVRAGKACIPHVVVDFSAHDPTGDPDRDKSEGRLLDPVGQITSLQAPHRLADAILRDAELDGKPFRRSARGKPLDLASAANATAVFELCPTALLFGMWDSTGPKGGLGAKFERAVVSEIVGIGAQEGDLRRGVRRDPLGISKDVPIKLAPDKSWEVGDPAAGRQKGAKGEKIVRPSEINHSSVLFPEQVDKKTEENYYDGVTIEYAEQTTTLSLVCLRRLRFPLNGRLDPEVDAAARTVLAALGLAAATLAFEFGTGLRSRCLLWPDAPMAWELLDRPGTPPYQFALSGDAALGLLRGAIGDATKLGLHWPEEPVRLVPSSKLLRLVRLSQEKAVQEGLEQAES